MSKGNSTTRRGSAATTRSAAVVNGGASITGRTFNFQDNPDTVSRYMSQMQNELRNYGQANGFERLTGDSIWKEILSPSSYVINYAISVAQEFTSDGFRVSYQPHIGSTRSPNLEAPDRNEFHRLVSERKNYNTIKEAEKDIQDRIKKINKLDLGIR